MRRERIVARILMARPPSDPSKKIVARPLDEVRRARGLSIKALPRSKVSSLKAFRRMKADRVFGGIGVALVLVSVLLIFSWEKPPVVEKKFGVEWPETKHVRPDESQVLLQGASENYVFSVAESNVTRVVVWLSWKDDIGDQPIEGDNFSIEIMGPEATQFTLNRSRLGDPVGNLSFTIPVSDVPQISQILADSEAKAREGVGDPTNETGVGDWRIKVTLLDAGDDYKNNAARDTPCPSESPTCTPDNSNAFLLHFEYSTYRVVYKKLF